MRSNESIDRFFVGLIVIVILGTSVYSVSANNLEINKETSFEQLTDFDLNHEKLFWKRGKVLRIIDGDTYKVLIDKGNGDYTVDHIRMDGIDTPESVHRPGGLTDEEWKKEQAEGKKATRYVEKRLEGNEFLVKISGRGNFGRLLAKIQLPDSNVTLNQELLNKNLAEPSDY